MVGIITNLGTRMYSHNAGWTYVTRRIISDSYGHNANVEVVSNADDFNDYDVLYINEGVNFKPGSFNFFGGAQQRQIDALKKYSEFKGEVFHLNNFVDYSIPCKKRKDLVEVKDLVFPEARVVILESMGSNIIIGDSHSVSAFKPQGTIKRMDGKTLNGALNIGLKNLIPYVFQKKVQFYFGNIDVRFHFKRFGGDNAVKDLMHRYYHQLIELKNEGYDITLTHLIPVEDESRKIPGTGKYKGENFFGTQQERLEYVKIFNNYIGRIADELNFKVVKWDHLNYEGLSFDDMESRQSVHLRPSSYLHIDLIKSDIPC